MAMLAKMGQYFSLIGYMALAVAYVPFDHFALCFGVIHAIDSVGSRPHENLRARRPRMPS